MNVEGGQKHAREAERAHEGTDANPLDTSMYDSGPPKTPRELPDPLPRWLTVDQIRRLQRMRKETVVEAMNNGELPFEQRGRIRYARLTDVLAWEERRLKPDHKPVKGLVHPDLAHLA